MVSAQEATLKAEVKPGEGAEAVTREMSNWPFGSSHTLKNRQSVHLSAHIGAILGRRLLSVMTAVKPDPHITGDLPSI